MLRFDTQVTSSPTVSAQLVGQRRHGKHLGARAENKVVIVLAHLLAGADAVENRGDGAGDAGLGPDDADVGGAVDGDEDVSMTRADRCRHEYRIGARVRRGYAIAGQ